MIHHIQPQEFLTLSRTIPIIDVRAPLEFHQGHIPHAHNVPLFTNEGRAYVGTIYKHQGKDSAIKQGINLVMPRLNDIIETIQQIAPTKKILIHCARGGMRSSSVAHMLTLFGYDIYLLQGGYKTYKAYTRTLFAQSWNMMILSGKTGVGKTEILHYLASRNEQIIDLEKLAHHNGSVFGGMGKQAQPTQEQFQNNLAHVLHAYDISRTIWLEDESNKIGNVIIPETFWKSMRNAPVVIIEATEQQRIDRLLKDYGHYSEKELAANVMRLEKHLGKERATALAQTFLERRFEHGDITSIQELVHHYDKAYEHAFIKRNPHIVARCTSDTFSTYFETTTQHDICCYEQ